MRSIETSALLREPLQCGLMMLVREFSWKGISAGLRPRTMSSVGADDRDRPGPKVDQQSRVRVRGGAR